MAGVANWLKRENSRFAINYLVMRRLIGILGFSLPFILAIGILSIKSCISDYYYTAMRDVFVGILFAVALFLFSYRGYRHIDDLAGTLGAIFALGVALSPCAPDNAPPGTPPGILHVIFAALFFADLIFFSCYLFTKSDQRKEDRTKTKKRRNRWYWACGIIMFVSIAGIPVIKLFPGLQRFNPEFWMEAIALMAFGVSWLIKGRTFAKINDEQYMAARS